MSQFCTACGTPVEEGLRFCSQCGASIAAAEPTVANVMFEPAPVPGEAPVPGLAPAAAPPAKSSSSILKIVIIVVLVFVLLGVAGMATCAYMAYRMKNKVTEQIKLNEDKKTIEIPTPGGTIKMGETSAETPKEIGGVPVYPGAKAQRGAGNSLSATSSRLALNSKHARLSFGVLHFHRKIGACARHPPPRV